MYDQYLVYPSSLLSETSIFAVPSTKRMMYTSYNMVHENFFESSHLQTINSAHAQTTASNSSVPDCLFAASIVSRPSARGSSLSAQPSVSALRSAPPSLPFDRTTVPPFSVSRHVLYPARPRLTTRPGSRVDAEPSPRPGSHRSPRPPFMVRTRPRDPAYRRTLVPLRLTWRPWGTPRPPRARSGSRRSQRAPAHPTLGCTV